LVIIESAEKINEPQIDRKILVITGIANKFLYSETDFFAS